LHWIAPSRCSYFLLNFDGIFSFLPVLGLWMRPLGLLLFAQGLPVLQKPTARMLGWNANGSSARRRKARDDSRRGVFDSLFAPAATRGCDSKANPAD
jgi:hypothetical protein